MTGKPFEMTEVPPPIEDLERPFWMSRSVARVMGLNLSRAMSEGRLSPDEYAELVTLCRSADCHDACMRWLASQTGARPEGPPEYCACGGILKRLAPREGKRTSRSFKTS